MNKIEGSFLESEKGDSLELERVQLELGLEEANQNLDVLEELPEGAYDKLEAFIESHPFSLPTVIVGLAGMVKVETWEGFVLALGIGASGALLEKSIERGANYLRSLSGKPPHNFF